MFGSLRNASFWAADKTEKLSADLLKATECATKNASGGFGLGLGIVVAVGLWFLFKAR
jgi:hypothetical protein